MRPLIYYRAVCRGRSVLLTDHDRVPQLDGSRVVPAKLTTAHVVPGAGRVMSCRRVGTEAQ